MRPPVAVRLPMSSNVYSNCLLAIDGCAIGPVFLACRVQDQPMSGPVAEPIPRDHDHLTLRVTGHCVALFVCITSICSSMRRSVLPRPIGSIITAWRLRYADCRLFRKLM